MKPVRARLPVLLAVVALCAVVAPLWPAAAKDQAAENRQASGWQRELIERANRMARIAGGAGSIRQGRVRHTAPRGYIGSGRHGSLWSVRPRSTPVAPLRASDDWFQRRLHARYGYGGDLRHGYGSGDRYRYGYPYGYHYGERR